MAGLFIFGVFFAYLMLRRFWKAGDLDPIVWKWLVRLIWLGSIVSFQVLELNRYHEGLPYRPFFGLYAGAIFAFVVWVTARLCTNMGRG